jgi:hypothetical protein
MGIFIYFLSLSGSFEREGFWFCFAFPQFPQFSRQNMFALLFDLIITVFIYLFIYRFSFIIFLE